jgi:cell division protein FtsW (lipid II flippase)
MKAFAKTDKVLLFTTMCLVVFGIFVFGSAALGVLSVDEGKFYSILENQLIYALLGGLFALFLGTIINFKLYQKFAYYLFGIGLFITSLVFVPGIQMYHGGAHRGYMLDHFLFNQVSYLNLFS